MGQAPNPDTSTECEAGKLCVKVGVGLSWAQTPTLPCSELTLSAALARAEVGLALLSITLVLHPSASVTAPLKIILRCSLP